MEKNLGGMCKAIRKDILHISKASGHGHIPTCFSIVEILVALYSTVRHDPKKPKWEERDLVVLSKGHGALALYAVMARFGYFDIKDVEKFGSFKTIFGCHANRLKVPGVEVSTGSLGHGIGVAVGMALALKIKKSARQVYVVIGDGESNEGTVWEAVLAAESQKLDNLTIIYDDNRSHPRGLQITNPSEKFAAFGCSVSRVPGHDLNELSKAICSPNHGKPRVVVADTIKGCGSKTMMSDVYAWHRRSPSDAEYPILLKEIDEMAV
ncbi:MAG: transketolase [Nitrospinae bacterium]|nr:transketolase [Nitrospinota bacterium]